ncbi:MAG: hypothetical protein M3285_14175 [Actinomycetota bacterium]|nr:hypothetical protein [Actinomycetota bacterium]
MTEPIRLDRTNFSKGTPLHDVHLAQAAVLDAQEELHRQVLAARDAGWSWGYIGSVLGTTRQAAEQRFNKPVKPWR